MNVAGEMSTAADPRSAAYSPLQMSDVHHTSTTEDRDDVSSLHDSEYELHTGTIGDRERESFSAHVPNTVSDVDQRENEHPQSSSTRLSKPKPVVHEKFDHDASSPAYKSKIHWRAPTVMVVAFAAGVAFALGHHFFYRRWNGQLVSDSLPQQWVTRIGTAFAFLVKMSLAISTGSAYLQQLWLILQHRPARTREVDGMFSVLKDALHFRHVGMWSRNPLLLILAIVTWLLPFAAVVTPGTITVAALRQDPTIGAKVPQLAFNASAYASTVVNSTGSFYAGPTDELFRLALATATRNEVLQIPSEYANMTYQLQYFAPALNCSEGDPNIRLRNQQCFGMQVTDATITYFAYVPPNSTSGVLDCTTSELSPLDTGSATSAKIFISAYNTWLMCTLGNVSHTVEFTMKYPTQSIQVVSSQYLNGVNGRCTPDSADEVGYASHMSYQAIMDAFGRILVGKDTGQNWTYSNVQPSLFRSTLPADVFDSSASSTSVRNSIEELFQNITLSLMSSVSFIENAATAGSTDAIIEQYPAVYIYKPRDLYLAYGISILCAAICLGIGAQALYRNQASYSSDFTTIVRTTRRAEMDSLVSMAESGGEDPLPSHIGNALISFQRPSAQHEYQGFRIVSRKPYQEGDE